ncbi:uncharacterized protein LOC120982333 isoform X2 [Bufo bufo]|nr:uncharacterized protein LOC120982333 isoform X2 [Bufo bufo]
MPSLGYLLLFSLAVALIYPASGGYSGQRCSKPVSNCQTLKQCRSTSDCSSGQSCCDSGCGLRCTGLTGFLNFFKNLFPCGQGGCGGG